MRKAPHLGGPDLIGDVRNSESMRGVSGGAQSPRGVSSVWVEYLTGSQDVAGSSPARSTFYYGGLLRVYGNRMLRDGAGSL